MSGISGWVGGRGVLGGETIDLVEVEGMRSNRCLSLYYVDDPRTLTFLTLRGCHTSPDDMKISQLFVGRCEAMAVFIQSGEFNNELDTLLLILMGVRSIGCRNFSVNNS